MATDISVEQKIAEVIGQTVTADAHLGDLDMDSLEYLEMLKELEIDFDDASNCETVGDLARLCADRKVS